jgi:hypothetical protein
MDMEGVPTIAREVASTTGANTLGVVVGFLPDPTALQTKHRAASTNRVALVVTDPSVVYEVQEDGDGGVIAQASIGNNAGVVTTAGSAVTGRSAMELDSSSTATTSTLPLKVLGLVKRPGNTLGAASTGGTKYEVLLNTGQLNPLSVGIA